ncbi:phosphoribosyltransferase-like protein [Pseudomonas corrugata]
MATELTLGDLQAIAEELADRYLAIYTEKIRSLNPSRTGKEVNDALWGTISLSPLEVVILDSPLLQRLRFVRQLGVAHWVYPGAVHTRFEHTLGVVHQMQQLITALNAAAQIEKSESRALISKSEAQLLRLCALLHDIGHAAFSHVSEKSLESLPEFATLSREFSNDLSMEDRGEDKQLSEMLAYYIVRSPAMRNLLDAALKHYRADLELFTNDEKNLNSVIEKVSLALIGRKIDNKRPLIHELISGPFDADKLDYLSRDAKLSGTPSLLDIPRLVQKIAVRVMPAADLPQDIAGQIQIDEDDGENHDAWLFGVKVSGKSILDELQLARMLAYAKIYRHPKVIAIEQMIRAFIEAIAKITDPKQLLVFLYTQADDALIGLGQAELREAMKVSRATPRIKTALSQAEAALKAIRERRLWVRAFQLNNSDIMGRYEIGSEGMDLFRADIDHPQAREEFVRRVRDETFNLLQMNILDISPSRSQLDSMIMIRVLNSSSGETQTGRAYIIPKSGSPVQFSRYVRAQGSWVEQYMSDQPKAFIFSPSDIADAVFMAVERVVRKFYNWKLSSWIEESSKRDKKIIKKLKRKIPPEGWKGIPFDIRPMPDRLKNQDVIRKLEKFDEMRSSFQEPDAPAWANDYPSQTIPREQRTRAWLHQFDNDEHVNCALHLLESFKMLTRYDTTATLDKFFEQNPEFRGAWVVPFGDAKDSGAVQAYLIAGHSHVSQLGTLDDYEQRGQGRPLIILDDFIGSGGQATDILAAWFKRTDLRKDLGEQRDALTPKIATCLKESKIAFVFVSGWDQGIQAIRDVTQKLELSALVFCNLEERDIPFAQQSLLKAKVPVPVIDSFLLRCQEIGADLVRSEPGKEQLSDEKVLERSLGYGGKAMLMASFVNVPTQTLTAIWMSGKADNVPWSPLLRRRKKS